MSVHAAIAPTGCSTSLKKLAIPTCGLAEIRMQVATTTRQLRYNTEEVQDDMTGLQLLQVHSNAIEASIYSAIPDTASIRWLPARVKTFTALKHTLYENQLLL